MMPPMSNLIVPLPERIPRDYPLQDMTIFRPRPRPRPQPRILIQRELSFQHGPLLHSSSVEHEVSAIERENDHPLLVQDLNANEHCLPEHELHVTEPVYFTPSFEHVTTGLTLSNSRVEINSIKVRKLEDNNKNISISHVNVNQHEGTPNVEEIVNESESVPMNVSVEFPPQCVTYATSNSIISVSSDSVVSMTTENRCSYAMFSDPSYISINSSIVSSGSSPQIGTTKRKLFVQSLSHHDSFGSQNIQMPPSPRKKPSPGHIFGKSKRKRRCKSLPAQLKHTLPEPDDLEQIPAPDLNADLSVNFERFDYIDVESDPGPFHTCIRVKKKRPRVKYVKTRFLPERNRKKPERYNSEEFAVKKTPAKELKKKKKLKNGHLQFDFQDRPQASQFMPHPILSINRHF